MFGPIITNYFVTLEDIQIGLVTIDIATGKLRNSHGKGDVSIGWTDEPLPGNTLVGQTVNGHFMVLPGKDEA